MLPARPFRVLVTRSPHQASELANHLRALGMEPVLIPAIEIVDPQSFAVLDAALGELQQFDWLLFTSANAVEAFHQRTKLLKLNFSNTTKLAAIGSATARALREIGLEPDLVPKQAVAESLADSLLPYARQEDGSATRFLLIRAEEAREHLPETLRGAGAEVTIAPAYRTVVPKDSVGAIRELFGDSSRLPDAITFTSSSAVRNLFALLETAGVEFSLLHSESKPALASIGTITSGTLRELGYLPDVEAEQATVVSLAEGLGKFLLRKTQSR